MRHVCVSGSSMCVQFDCIVVFWMSSVVQRGCVAAQLGVAMGPSLQVAFL